MIENKFIRNFSIIAHIDHGKSTLADRILEIVNYNKKNNIKIKDRILDSMELEREKGITIKSNVVELKYISDNKKEYILHLIDTPGHVDFSYEVYRSLDICEGVILLIDAKQGIEAQTIANFKLAIKKKMSIIPVINKIDLPNINFSKIYYDLKFKFNINKNEVIFASAKLGIGIKKILERIIKKIPYPKGNISLPLKAIIFDSIYDNFKGIILIIRIINGIIKIGDELFLFNSKINFIVNKLGKFNPKMFNKNILISGEVGFIITGIKKKKNIKIGDLIILYKNRKNIKNNNNKLNKIFHVVYCGIYLIDSMQFKFLRDALYKLQLNDSSFCFEIETSIVLGNGFRCGFLGLLHMDIILERLKREFNLLLIITAPTVIYRLKLKNNKKILVSNPSKFPRKEEIIYIEEPYIEINVNTENIYIGKVIKLLQNNRGKFINIKYLEKNQVDIIYNIPLSEIIIDFFDKLKSLTKGYSDIKYKNIGYKKNDLVKVDILLNFKKIDALSFIIFKKFAYKYCKLIIEKLKNIIPRKQFEIPIQAVINNKVISRANIKALRKNVLAKCYGGDISRKRKLLEKQKAGKKKMKSIGLVDIPKEVFYSVFTFNKK